MKMVGSKTIRKKQTPREGCNQTSVGLIPDEWKKLKLSEVCIKIQDGTHFSPKIVANGQRLYITSKNVRIGKLDLSNVDYISEEDHNNIYKRCDVKRNDILLTKDGANTGNACINNLDDEFSLLSSVAFLRPDKSVTDFKFLYQLLVSPKSQYLIKESMAGQAITRITLNKLKSFQFYFPPLPEQQKIAAILSTWDEAIEKTQSLIDQIRQRNKGLAQQLLTGKKRLKGFSEKWKHDPLELYFMERKELGYGQLPLLSVGESGVYPQSESNKKDTSNQDKSLYKRICFGDIGYNTMRMWQGRSALSELEGIVSPAYTIVSPKDNADAEFFSYLFKLDTVIHKFYRNSQGLVSDTLSCKFKDFKIVKVDVPPSIQEQKAIAKVLNLARVQLKRYEETLATLMDQKRGLMQKLLTGEIRVKTNVI